MGLGVPIFKHFRVSSMVYKYKHQYYIHIVHKHLFTQKALNNMRLSVHKSGFPKHNFGGED